ncbi:MAG: DsrE family protein, partial [Candidatus Limnocylindria bacterium]
MGHARIMHPVPGDHRSMSRILIQLATGPENSTRAALAFLVARTAAADGHDVTLFLAGDAVSLL